MQGVARGGGDAPTIHCTTLLALRRAKVAALPPFAVFVVVCHEPARKRPWTFAPA